AFSNLTVNRLRRRVCRVRFVAHGAFTIQACACDSNTPPGFFARRCERRWGHGRGVYARQFRPCQIELKQNGEGPRNGVLSRKKSNWSRRSREVRQLCSSCPEIAGQRPLSSFPRELCESLPMNLFP